MIDFKGMVKYFTNAIRLATKEGDFGIRFVQPFIIFDFKLNKLTVCLQPELHVNLDMLCIPFLQERLCIQGCSF